MVYALHSSQVKVDRLTFLACAFTYNKDLQHVTFVSSERILICVITYTSVTVLFKRLTQLTQNYDLMLISYSHLYIPYYSTILHFIDAS